MITPVILWILTCNPGIVTSCEYIRLQEDFANVEECVRNVAWLVAVYRKRHPHDILLDWKCIEKPIPTEQDA